MSVHRFKQVDVFSAKPLLGNPLAVVFDAEGIDTATMLALTRWTNLSEAVFLLPPVDPRADYRLRIFSPDGEMDFAGHPTLGACHAWLESGGRPLSGHIVQECGIGLVRIRRDENTLSFAAPALRRSGPVDDALRARVVAGLGLAPTDMVDARWADNGSGWIGVLVRERDTVLALRPDPPMLEGLKLGIIAPWPDGVDAQFEMRALVFIDGMREDPATGSLNAGVAQWFAEAGIGAARYVVSQGTSLGRAARLHIVREAEDIWIGGETVTCVEGELRLP